MNFCVKLLVIALFVSGCSTIDERPEDSTSSSAATNMTHLPQNVRNVLALCGAGIASYGEAKLSFEAKVVEAVNSVPISSSTAEASLQLKAAIGRAVETTIFRGKDVSDPQVNTAYNAYLTCIEPAVNALAENI